MERKLNVYASLLSDMIQFVFEYAVKKKVRWSMNSRHGFVIEQQSGSEEQNSW
jgi:hypothetical protein